MAFGSLVVTIYFIYVVTKEQPLVYRIAIGCITGGAYGNLMDRVRMTKVVDFIEMGIPSATSPNGGWFWPVYNVADMFVVIGVAVLFIYTLKYEKNNKKEKIESNNEV